MEGIIWNCFRLSGIDLLQLWFLKWISEVYKSLSHQNHLEKYKHKPTKFFNSKYRCLSENDFEMENNFLLLLGYCSVLFGSWNDKDIHLFPTLGAFEHFKI